MKVEIDFQRQTIIVTEEAYAKGDVIPEGERQVTEWSISSLAMMGGREAVGKAFAILRNDDGRVTVKDLGFSIEAGQLAAWRK
jgi:hypothetical protein